MGDGEFALRTRERELSAWNLQKRTQFGEREEKEKLRWADGVDMMFLRAEILVHSMKIALDHGGSGRVFEDCRDAGRRKYIIAEAPL